jgi:hypothetical protein
MGQAYLSGALRAAGHDTNILHISEWLDYPFHIERAVSDVKDYGPDLIAMSTGANITRRPRAAPGDEGFDAPHPDHPRRHPRDLNTATVMKEAPSTSSASAGGKIIDLAYRSQRAATTTSNLWCRKDEKIKSTRRAR